MIVVALFLLWLAFVVVGLRWHAAAVEAGRQWDAQQARAAHVEPPAPPVACWPIMPTDLLPSAGVDPGPVDHCVCPVHEPCRCGLEAPLVRVPTDPSSTNGHGWKVRR